MLKWLVIVITTLSCKQICSFEFVCSDILFKYINVKDYTLSVDVNVVDIFLHSYGHKAEGSGSVLQTNADANVR